MRVIVLSGDRPRPIGMGQKDEGLRSADETYRQQEAVHWGRYRVNPMTEVCGWDHQARTCMRTFHRALTDIEADRECNTVKSCLLTKLTNIRPNTQTIAYKLSEWK